MSVVESIRGMIGSPASFFRRAAVRLEHPEFAGCRAPGTGCSVPAGQTWCRGCGAQNYLNTIVKMIQDFGGDGFVDEIDCIELGPREHHGLRREVVPMIPSVTVFGHDPRPIVPIRRLHRLDGGTIFGIRIAIVPQEGMRLVAKE